MKLLLDENLSPTIAQRLRSEDSIDAVHVEERAMLGATDAEIFAKAFAEDRVLVTLNVRDFVKLAHAAELHAGLVLIERESMLRDEQLACIRAVIARLAGEEMANRALRVIDEKTFALEDIPK